MARFACTSIMESGSCGSSWERRMSDEYLWDPTAVPDPEIQRLEALLRPAAYTSAPLRESTVPPRRIRVGVWSALAAAAVIAVGGVYAVRRASVVPWTVTAERGAPVVRGASGEPSRVAVALGGVVGTDARSYSVLSFLRIVRS